MKRLICCFDGTWDTPTAENVTNVVKLHRAIPPVDGNGVVQISHYEVGIATEFSGKLSFWAGALAFGVSDRVQKAYRFLCAEYQPGDEIYAFGFSRGAFEARILAHFIASAGLNRTVAVDGIGALWQRYQIHMTTHGLAKAFGHGDQPIEPVPIHCVGVWDTVGNLANAEFPRLFVSALRHLPRSVKVGLQALSIDEPRGAFSPILWTKRRADPPVDGQAIEQTWFAGSHDDIGGGGHCNHLSDIALLWMAERVCASTPLAIDLDKLRAAAQPDPLSEQHVPTVGLYRISGLAPFVRLINQDLRAVSAVRRACLRGWRTNRLSMSEATINEALHSSVLARIGKTVPFRRGTDVQHSKYVPKSVQARPDDR